MAKTVAIIDCAHSGTTMVAGLCHILGIPMVFENYKEHKLEDMNVRWAIKNEKRFAELVKERDEQYGSWGFKRPGAWTFPASLAHLSNPIYLVIYKDPVSVTGRRFNEITPYKVYDTLKQMMVSIEGIRALGLPIHLLSYQRAIVMPEIFVSELARIIGADDNFEKAVEFIRPNTTTPRQPYPEAVSWI